MSRYDKRKEYDMINYLEKKGLILVKHYGDRRSRSGDFLVSYKNMFIRIDHKSTTSEAAVSARIQKSWLTKLSKENDNIQGILSIPVVTLSFHGWRSYYCIIDKKYYTGKDPTSAYIADTKYKSWVIPRSTIKDSPVIQIGQDVYFMNIDILLRMIDSDFITYVSSSTVSP